MEGPRLLLMETSGRFGQVALAEGAVLLGTRALDETRRHARDLAPAVAALLQAQNWRPADVNAVVVSRGPGSYTGLRVGLISAQAFAFATGCALLAVDTFAIIARQTPPEASHLAVLADAQQGQVYLQRFTRAADDWTAGPLLIQAFDALLAECPGEMWLSGPGLDAFVARLPPDQPVAPPEARHPQVASLLAIGLERFQRGDRDDLWKLEPLYARPSAAERQWDSPKE